MGSPKWETPDVAGMLDGMDEATVAGNVGPFEVPLGAPLRRPMTGAQDDYEIPPEYRELFGLDPEVP